MAETQTNKKILFYWLGKTNYDTKAKIVAFVEAHLNGLIFAESITTIYAHGQAFGIDPESFSEIAQLRTDHDALEDVVNKLTFFSKVAGDNGSLAGATKPGSTLNIKGDTTGTTANAITTAVGETGVTITLNAETGTTSGTIKFGTKEIKVADWKSSEDITKEINAAKDIVLGKSSDASTTATVYGARALADTKVASVTATANAGIAIGGTATAPTVGIKIAAKAKNTNNVTISTDTAGLKAHVTREDIAGLGESEIFVDAALTGTPTAPTATAGTNTTQIATTAFVVKEIADKISAADAMRYKGTIGTGGTVTALPTDAENGDTYKAIAGCPNVNGQKVEPGDMIICVSEASTKEWTVVQANIDGAVTSASALTADQLVLGGGNQTAKVLAAGTNGQVLKMTNGKPTWSANTADKVANKLSVTIGSNAAKEFDGSTEQTLTITPATIGAATAAQGTKADTAVQTVTATGKDHLTLTAGAKSAAGAIEITGELKTANVAASVTAANDGLATAKQTSEFIESVRATLANADTTNLNTAKKYTDDSLCWIEC